MGTHVNSPPGTGTGLASGTDYYFALLPDDRVRSEIATVSERFRHTHRLLGNAVDPARFQMTLCPTGRPERLRGPLQAALMEAGAKVRIKSFEITLDSAMRLTAKKGQFPFVLCMDSASAEAAMSLRKAIAVAQAEVGLSVPGVSSYMPHLSLLHGPMIDAIEVSMPPLCWRVHEFVLIHSFFGQSRQEVVGRWPLAPLF